MIKLLSTNKRSTGEYIHRRFGDMEIDPNYRNGPTHFRLSEWESFYGIAPNPICRWALEHGLRHVDSVELPYAARCCSSDAETGVGLVKGKMIGSFSVSLDGTELARFAIAGGSSEVAIF